MKKAQIVLGLQFGDEGKGRTVDYLSSFNPNSIVIRFSGGQNCGHTVVKDGIKHVFGNFGSGTMRQVPTYFSEHCSIYLNAINKEKNLLLGKGFVPKLYLHPLTKITTPFDLVYNQLLEKINNHSSVGVGIGTTMKRHNNTGYKLYAMDLRHPKIFNAKLDEIQKYYDGLVEKLGISSEEWLEKYALALSNFKRIYQQHCLGLNRIYDEIRDYEYLRRYEHLIFEGSQGILLDMDHGIFPNVTYANTTSKNAVQICDKLGIIPKMYYVTRCYQTRHGNGWMSNQEPIKLINNQGEINVYNEWQGEFKVGEIDYDLINYALDVDSLYSNGYVNRNLVITCNDQRPDFNFNTARINYFFDDVWKFQGAENETFHKRVEKMEVKL